MSWLNKKVTVIGLGKSGLAVIKKLVSLNAQVFLSDIMPQEIFPPQTIAEIKNTGIQYEFGQHSEKSLENCDLIVVSPGVHLDLAIFEEAKNRNIPVISEIELAFQRLKKPIIAVTGTNGKTTTVTLIGELLKAAGYQAICAGNIGYPLIEVDDKDLDYIVVEVSSYQLESIQEFRPYISLLLNITEDHLERHKTIEEYSRIKSRVFENQTPKDYLIYNCDDKRIKTLVKKARAKKIAFSLKAHKKGGSLKKNQLFFNAEPLININEIFIKGRHNLQNILSAICVAKICRIPDEVICQVLREFKGVEHRIEYVNQINQASFYNDSKGTNPDSTIVALKSFGKKKKIILIAGGRDKKTSLTELCRQIKKYTKGVILIGEARERFEQAFADCGYRKTYAEKDLKSAVEKAFALSQPEDIILFSPACASFDMFKNFEDRGQKFKDIVNSIAKEKNYG